jgi:dihydroorotase
MITIKNGYVLEGNNLVLKDLYIADDVIIKVGENLEVMGELVDAKGGFIMPGATDVHVHMREPGYSHKETIHTASMGALKGGVTTCLAMPNLNPCPDSLENLNVELEIIERDGLVNIYPYGAVTVAQKGMDLADLESFKDKVCAITDDGVGVNNIDLLVKAMKFAKENDMVIASHAEDSVNGKLPEGEYKAVIREIELAKEIGCKYHFCHMSTKESFEAIKKAQEEGYPITCEVAPHHLILNESMIKDANWKMNPPLRDEENRLETVKALLSGVACMVASDHAPHSEEEKSREYDKCPNGILGLETMLPVVYTHFVKTGMATLKDFVSWFVDNPNKVFNLGERKIEVGYPADITILDLDNKHVYTKDEIVSLSKNSPYIGMEFYGFPILTMVSGKVLFKK